MIATVIGVSLVALLVLVAVSAVNGDAQLTSRDISRKQAYEAAKAGIDEYAYHLHANSGYWAECTEPAATKKEPAGTKNGLNQVGSTSNRRAAPGGGSEYAIELIPATGHANCDRTTLSTATASMLESGEAMKGTFRIRSNGYSGSAHVAITATFKPASYLDYVYFTQYETSDPVTYGITELIKAAERQCTKWIRQERYALPLSNEKGEALNRSGEVYKGSNGESRRYCDTISFVGGDNIKGPMHTNDAFVICEEPTLGRNVNDPIEVSSPPKGIYPSYESSLNNPSNCRSYGIKKILGSFRTNAPVIVPPESNSELETIAEPGYLYEGEISICLEGSTMEVNPGRALMVEKKCPGTGIKKPFPSNGVVYVKSVSCTGAYSPFDLSYSSTASECGNVNVSGTYSKPLTIGAANDVIITESLTKNGESGMLGLIGNNFIRVYHPVNLETKEQCEQVWENSHWVTKCKTVINCLSNATGSLSNLTIEAAMLALKHSIIVDNYDCGAQLGYLNVKGALAQKFRGAVGTSNSTGYLKNYEYDERFKTTEPPSFLQPIKSDWVIGRETTE